MPKLQSALAVVANALILLLTQKPQVMRGMQAQAHQIWRISLLE
jgi:hypothetical protein